MRRRLFTLDEANELVPWLESTFRRLAPLREELAGLQSRLSDLQRQHRGNGVSSPQGDMARIQSDLERLLQQVQDGLNEIAGQGIIVRDVTTGLVDFPSVREGREVYLCWISGEDRIGYWHETDRGFAHRQPL